MAKRATKDVFKVSKKDSGDTSWMCGLIDGTELDSAPELLGERQETAHILGTSYFLYFLPLGTLSAHSRHTWHTWPGNPENFPVSEIPRFWTLRISYQERNGPLYFLPLGTSLAHPLFLTTDPDLLKKGCFYI